MVAYDYDQQEWIEGKAGRQLRIKQINEEIELIEGPRGLSYLTTMTTMSRPLALECLKAELSKLTD